MHFVDWPGIDFSEHILQPFIRINIIQFTGAHQAIDHSLSFGCFMTAGEHKVISAGAIGLICLSTGLLSGFSIPSFV
jgi:hypothetical protein